MSKRGAHGPYGPEGEMSEESLRKRHKKDKKDKKEKRDKKEKKEKKAKKDKKDKSSRGNNDEATLHSQAPELQISADDYFEKSREFRMWLRQEKHRTLESYSTEDARDVFQRKFCRAWNRGLLDASFYSGDFSRDELDRALKTEHRWSFTMSERERDNLDSLAGSVQRNTERPEVDLKERPGSGWSSGRTVSTNMATGLEYRRREREHMREVAPKETGFEAKLLKRRETNDRLHGAHRDRELNGDGEVPENFSMGGSDPFLDRQLQRIKKRDARKADEQQERLRQHQEEEQRNIAQIRASLGLKSGEKLSIKPRSS